MFYQKEIQKKSYFFVIVQKQKAKIIALLFLKANFKVFGNINHIPQNTQSMKGKYFIKHPSHSHLQKDFTSLLNSSQQTTQYYRPTHNTMLNSKPYRIKTEGPQPRSTSKEMVKLHGSHSSLKRNKQYFPANKQNVKSRKSNKNVIRNTYNERRVSDFDQIEKRNLQAMITGKNRMSETKYVAKKSLHKMNMRARYKACSPTVVKDRKMKQVESSFEAQPFQNIFKQIFLQQKSKSKPRKKQLGPEDIVVEEMIGSGTFGKVFSARIKSSGEKIALKKVQKDKKYKTRELQMLQLVESPFIIKTFSTFTAQQGKHEYINIAMQAFDQNFFQLLKIQPVSAIEIKCYVYQMLRGLHYLHGRGICHRDLKPQNLLVKNRRLVICDFGSAKILRPGEQNISYICSRCYRAPELIFEATNYTTQIDMWSLGCILIEIINDRPLFIADSSLNHILQVIKILGTPSKEDIRSMNPNYDLSQYELPRIKAKSFKNLFPETDLLFIDLIEKIVKYSPQKRLTAAEALAHQYFDDLRNEKTYRSIPYFQGLQLFFDFQKEILPLPLRDKLVPRWWRVGRK